jgi:deoxyguanosine kinase
MKPEDTIRTYNGRRIEVCGGIGIGKSTLAARLAAHLANCELICEDFSANPLWHLYYGSPDRYVREKNISFLAQHFGELKHASLNNVVSDFSPVQDLAYAALVGDTEHELVMSNVFDHLYKHVSAPEVIVHVTSTVEKQLSQIALRGRKEEVVLSREILATLNDSLSNALRQHSGGRRVIRVDVTHLDLRTDVNLLTRLLQDFSLAAH